MQAVTAIKRMSLTVEPAGWFRTVWAFITNLLQLINLNVSGNTYRAYVTDRRTRRFIWYFPVTVTAIIYPNTPPVGQ